MAIKDLRTAPRNLTMETDVAIIGAGPAGLAIARELSGSHIRVTVLDSGGVDQDDEAQGFNRVENIGEPKPVAGEPSIGRGYNGNLAWFNGVPAFELRHRGLGGSARLWIGKCAAFDDMDYKARSWVPFSGWPVDGAGLAPYVDRAGELLNLGPNRYDASLYELLRSPPPEGFFGEGTLKPFFWQFSHERETAGEPMRFVRVAEELDDRNVDILMHATVTQIRTNASGRRISSLDVRTTTGNEAVIRARAVILCGGGIENARLLLASNATAPGGVGNDHGVVGRYLADHPRTVLARFPSEAIPAVSRYFGFYGLADRATPNHYLHGLALSPEVQAREGLLNCAAYPVQVLAEDDPWNAIKRLMRFSKPTLAADIAAVITSADVIAKGAYNRLIKGRGLQRKADELRFDVVTEQVPDPESRVTLSQARDPLGMPIATTNWRIGQKEIASIRRLAELTSNAFIRSGLPEPLLPNWVISSKDEGVPFMDMAHPSCTTRMGTDPRSSVVDPDCMVHGVDGLFVAGSSVFPTAGHANPTLMIMALAIRLADHVKAYCEVADAPVSLQPRVKSGPELPVRAAVGFDKASH